MIKKTALVLAVTLTLSATMMMSGCILAAVGAGAGGVFYAKGDLESTLAASPAQIAAAADKAFTELKIAKTSSVSSELDAEIVGRTATDKKVTITSKTTGDKLSSISIRVGTFGDEDLSQAIFEKIKKNL